MCLSLFADLLLFDVTINLLLFDVTICAALLSEFTKPKDTVKGETDSSSDQHTILIWVLSMNTIMEVVCSLVSHCTLVKFWAPSIIIIIKSMSA